MEQFPDESKMERSQDGTEVIRGGSIGLNRILSSFVSAAGTDHSPRFTAVLISAFTIFRNVYGTKKFQSISDVEPGFVADVNLFMEYFDTYLSHTWTRVLGDRFCPVIIYFPDYSHVPKEIRRESTGERGTIFDLYKIFLNLHGGPDQQVKVQTPLEHSKCFWVSAGHATYPHRDVARKFREITGHRDCVYTSGSPIALISHITLDHHISYRLRGIELLESYTGKIKPAKDLRYGIDKEGRVPFQSAPHVVLGDSNFIKPMVTPKIRKQILDTAVQDRWLSLGPDSVRERLSKITGISVSTLKKYDFV